LFYYFRLNFVWLFFGTFVLTWLLILQGFAGFGISGKKYFYVIIPLLCSELALGVAAWPTHFFVNAVVTFSAYYLLWVLAFAAFLGKLNRNKIYWQLFFVTFILALTLLTAAWKPAH
jgi:hypothetical protein